MKMKYTEQAVETLDDACSVIANKNIEIEQLRQRVAELEQQRNELVKACDALLEWDFVRGFRLPYKVRDPIVAAVVSVKGR